MKNAKCKGRQMKLHFVTLWFPYGGGRVTGRKRRRCGGVRGGSKRRSKGQGRVRIIGSKKLR